MKSVDCQIKNSPMLIIVYMCTYGTKNSDRKIKNSPIPTANKFAKFNTHQISHYTVLHFQVSTSNTIIASQIITVLLITIADLIINVP